MWDQLFVMTEKTAERNKIKIDKKLLKSSFDKRYLLNEFSFYSKESKVVRELYKEKSGNSKITKDQSHKNISNGVSMNMNPNTFTLRSKSKRPLFEVEDKRILEKITNIFDSFDQRENEMETEPCFLIKIESNFQQFWEYFLISTIIYSAFFFPISLCFHYSSELIFIIIDILIEIALIADIFLSFFTQFEDVKENIISSSEKIIESYLAGWFFLDLVTCFPATVIEMFLEDHSFIIYLKWFSLVRLLKIFKYSYLTHKNILENDRLDRILKQIICLIIMVNIFSCFFIFIGVNGHAETNWIEHSGISKTNNFGIYIGSIFFHFLNFFSLGFAGVEGVTIPERIYTIFLLIINFLLTPFILISISKVFVDDKPSDIQYFSKMNVMSRVHQKYKIRKALRNKISQTLKNFNEKQFELRRNFFDDLPLNIKHLLNNFIYKNRIKSVSFFIDQTYDFIIYTIPFLRHFKLKKHEVIYKIGEKVEDMFIVINGSISLRLGEEFSSLEVGVIRQRQHFGDTFLITGKTSPFECVAKNKNSEVFYINHQDFISLKMLFPKNILSITDVSLKMLEFFDQRKKNLINIFEHEKKKDKVISRIKAINDYLFERDFDGYYNSNKKIEGVNDFLINNPFNRIKTVFRSIERKNKRFDSERNPQISNLVYKKVLDQEKKEIDAISKSSRGRFNTAKSNFMLIDEKSQKDLCKIMRNSNLVKDENKKTSISQKKSINEKSDEFKLTRNHHLTINEVIKKSELNEISPKRRHKSECIKNKSLKKNKSFLTSKTVKNLNFESDANLNDITKNFQKFSKKKKAQSQKKFLKLLKNIYMINFQQELDLNSLKHEKEINNKVARIVTNNQRFENIVNCMEPEFKKKYNDELKNKLKYNFSNRIKSYSFENLFRENGKVQRAGLKITLENSIQIGNETHRFKNLKIVKTNEFKLNTPNYELFAPENNKIPDDTNILANKSDFYEVNRNLISEVFYDKETYNQVKKINPPFKNNLNIPSGEQMEPQDKITKLEHLFDLIIQTYKIE